MKRLTEKHIVDNIDCGYKIKKDTCEDGIIQGWNKTDAINKLGKLEDIEEELGIDKITYFKLKKGTKVYTNSPWLKEECVIESVFGVGKDIIYHICPSMYEKSGGYVGIDEYGTTFALTKEELE